MIRNLQKITSDYQRMWDQLRESLRAGDIDTDPVPVELSRRWGISVIFRPAEPALSALADAARQAASYAGSSQIVYDATNLHTTIFSIEFFRSHIPEDDARMRIYVEVLRSIAARHYSFDHRYEGLTANRLGVMVQGWPEDDSLQDIRDELHGEFRERGVLGGPEEKHVRQTSHASLLVFTGPLLDSAGLVSFLEKNRERDLGVSRVRALEIISYQRTMSGIGLIPHACASLRNVP